MVKNECWNPRIRATEYTLLTERHTYEFYADLGRKMGLKLQMKRMKPTYKGEGRE